MDAYSVLGIGRNASEDEIKSAYKGMIKKYHPDSYVNNPLSDLAAEKTKEVNEAYDRIMSERKSIKNNFNANNGGNYSGGASNFNYIRQMITNGQVMEADSALEMVPSDNRNAEWNFLKGHMYYRRGWMEKALEFYTKASFKDPKNQEYKMALQMLSSQRNGGFNGNPYGVGYNAPRSSGGGLGCCCDLLCLDSCCECMGGDLISCC